MATVTISRYLIECDGCHVIFGNRDGFASQMEARAVAFPEGWRFPSKVDVKGNAANASSDVCPKCIEDWEPAPIKGSSRGGRMLTNAERAQLPPAGE